MKEVKPQIKSRTKVKSMFEDCKTEEKADEILAFDAEHGKFADKNRLNNSDNGVVVLQRTRGDIVKDAGDTKVENVRAEAKKSSNIIEVQSKTYGENVDETKTSEKKTFKQYLGMAGVKIKQGWDSFIQRKGAVRLLAIIGVLVILSITLMIYASINRTSFNDIVKNECKAFVFDSGESSGVGVSKDIKVDDLTKDTPTNNKMNLPYRRIEFVGKDKGESVNIDTIGFNLYTDSANVTIIVKFEIFYGEKNHYALEKVVKMSQRVGSSVRFPLMQNIELKSTMAMVMTFETYNSDDYAKQKNEASLTNESFIVYNLFYK